MFSGQPGVHAPDPAEALGGEDLGRRARRLGAPVVYDHDPVGEVDDPGPYDEPIDDAEGLRKVTVKLARRARGRG
jgi:hypothetical protein